MFCCVDSSGRQFVVKVGTRHSARLSTRDRWNRAHGLVPVKHGRRFVVGVYHLLVDAPEAAGEYGHELIVPWV